MKLRPRALRTLKCSYSLPRDQWTTRHLSNTSRTKTHFVVSGTVAPPSSICPQGPPISILVAGFGCTKLYYGNFLECGPTFLAEQTTLSRPVVNDYCLRLLTYLPNRSFGSICMICARQIGVTSGLKTYPGKK